MTRMVLGWMVPLVFVVSALAGEPKSAIVYDNGHAFNLRAPEGWTLDNRAGIAEGLHAVFYPESSSWADSPVVMYATTAERSDPDHPTRDALIEFDVKLQRKGAPDLKVSNGQTVVTGDGKKALVKLFNGTKNGSVEAVAYIEEPKVVSMIVYSARDEEVFQSAYPLFEQLVGSYKFVSKPAKVEEKGTS